MYLFVSLRRRVRAPSVGLPHGRLRPGHADRRAALAAAVRVVTRVHHRAAHAWAAAHQALAAGAAELDLAVLHVADLADSGHALGEDAPDFAGRQADERVVLFAGEELRRSAGAADELGALTLVHFEVVDRRARRDVPERQGVSRLDLGRRARTSPNRRR